MTARLSGASSADLMTAAQTLWGEARGETFAGKIAVAHVMLSRLAVARSFMQRTGKPQHPLFGDGTLAGVCVAPQQFSCWNIGDPNRAEMLAVTLPAALGDRAFRDCLGALLDAVDGRTPDPTAGSTHYCAVGLTPAWAAGLIPVCTIGGHKFYNDVR